MVMYVCVCNTLGHIGLDLEREPRAVRRLGRPAAALSSWEHRTQLSAGGRVDGVVVVVVGRGSPSAKVIL